MHNWVTGNRPSASLPNIWKKCFFIKFFGNNHPFLKTGCCFYIIYFIFNWSCWLLMVIPMMMILLHINSELVSYSNWCKRGWCNGCWSTKAWPLFFFSSCEIFLGRDQKRVKPIVCSGLGAVEWRRWAVWFFGTLFCDILGHFWNTFCWDTFCDICLHFLVALKSMSSVCSGFGAVDWRGWVAWLGRRKEEELLEEREVNQQFTMFYDLHFRRWTHNLRYLTIYNSKTNQHIWR